MGAALYNWFFLRPWPFWMGGLVIGLLVPLMYYEVNTALGVSSGYGNILKMLMPGSKRLWLQGSIFAPKTRGRLFFLGGMVAGAFLSARLSGRPWIDLTMSPFTDQLAWSRYAMGSWFFCGGFLLGLGSRLSGGCTSGHSIHGIATGQKSSVLVTLGFVLAGIVVTWIIQNQWLGGV